MYIFSILEVEIIIFSYLDQITDWFPLRQTAHYYNNLLDNNLIKFNHNYNNLGDIFMTMCAYNDLYCAKYIYYRRNISNISKHIYSAFVTSCSKGHLNMIKWLTSLDQKIDVHANNEYAFRISCRNGQLDVAKWLFEESSKIENIKIDIDAQDRRAFRASCHNGHLDVAKWLFDLSENIDSNLIGSSFVYVCTKKSFNVAMAAWLLELNKDVNMRKYFIHAISVCCEYGYLDNVRWLFEMDGVLQIDIHYDGEYLFRISCMRGHLEIAKLLYEISKLDTKIDIHASNEFSFRTSCMNGFFDMAKWLFEISKEETEIDIHINDDSAFEDSCFHGYLDMAKWLLDLSGGKINISKNIDSILDKNKNNVEMTNWLIENYNKLV